MKTYRTLAITGVLFLSILLIFSCKKNQDLKADGETSQSKTSYQTGIMMANGSVIAGNVTLSVPSTVNVDEEFQISADISCGKISIERGFILAADGVTKIYNGLTCASEDLEWEVIVNFQCYTSEADWTGSLNAVGTYVFRTKHNGSDGNCDGLGGGNSSGECSFSGNEFYCFVIEAIDECETMFSGEALYCGNQREAVYTFKSENALDYIKIQGGLTNFTGDDAVITITGGNLTASQSTPGGSSNRVIKIEGSVETCEEVTISITWNSTNSGGVITGDWSVKDANGVEVAPSVAGLTCDN